MQLHKAQKVVEIMDDYLPRYYASTIKERIAHKHDISIDELAIRHIRSGIVSNPLVFEEMLAYAKEIKSQLEKLKQTAATV